MFIIDSLKKIQLYTPVTLDPSQINFFLLTYAF